MVCMEMQSGQRSGMCQLLNYCLSGPNLPFSFFSIMFGLGFCKLLFLLCQPVSWLLSSDTRNTGWNLESVMRGERPAPAITRHYHQYCFSEGPGGSTWSFWSLEVFCFVFLAFPGPVSQSSLRDTNISLVASVFRNLRLSSSSSNLQAPEVPTG